MVDPLVDALTDAFWEAFGIDEHTQRFGFTDRIIGRVDSVVPTHLFEVLAETARATLAEAHTAQHPYYVALAGGVHTESDDVIGVFDNLHAGLACAARAAAEADDITGPHRFKVQAWNLGAQQPIRTWAPLSDAGDFQGFQCDCEAPAVAEVTDTNVITIVYRCADHLELPQ